MDPTSDRLKYKFTEKPAGNECSYYVVQTLDRSINESGVHHFSFPGDQLALTQLNDNELVALYRVKNVDSTPLTPEQKVFNTPGALQALYRSSQVQLNKRPVSITNDYSLSSTLISYLTTNRLVRNDIWAPMSGWRAPESTRSMLDPLGPSAATFGPQIEKVAGSKVAVLRGRVTSDFLMSATQFVPPGMSIDVILTRGNDAFALCDKDNGDYKIEFISVSLAFKRIRPTENILRDVKSALSQGGAFRFNKLLTTVMAVPPGLNGFSWNDVFHGGNLPETLYFVMINQRVITLTLN